MKRQQAGFIRSVLWYGIEKPEKVKGKTIPKTVTYGIVLVN